MNPVPWSSLHSILKKMEQLQTWIHPEQTVLKNMCVRLPIPSLDLSISLSNVSINWIKNDPGSGLCVCVCVLSILVMCYIVLPWGSSRCNSAPPQERLDQGAMFQNKLCHTKTNFADHFFYEDSFNVKDGLWRLQILTREGSCCCYYYYCYFLILIMCCVVFFINL